jgi:flagellin-specific chaperone FliS
VAQKREVSTIIPETGPTSELSVRALEYYHKAKEYLRDGDWAGYGRELDKLENILKQLSNTTASQD